MNVRLGWVSSSLCSGLTLHFSMLSMTEPLHSGMTMETMRSCLLTPVQRVKNSSRAAIFSAVPNALAATGSVHLTLTPYLSTNASSSGIIHGQGLAPPLAADFTLPLSVVEAVVAAAVAAAG